MNNTYTLAAELLQAIVHNLNSQPAASTRGLLNAIEGECARQDKQRADEAATKQRESIHAELKAELLASQSPSEEVQTPAQATEAPPPTLPPIDG